MTSNELMEIIRNLRKYVYVNQEEILRVEIAEEFDLLHKDEIEELEAENEDLRDEIRQLKKAVRNLELIKK